MPHVTVLIGVFNPIDNFLDGIVLIGAQYHQAPFAFVQNDVFADDLPQRAFVEEEIGEHIQVIEWPVALVCPVECEFIAAVWVVCEITGVYTIGNHENLDVVEQPVKRGLVVALHLVVGLFQFDSALFQFDLYQRQSIHKDRYIIAAFFSSLDRYLVRYLKFVLTPFALVEKFDPDALPVFGFQRIEIAQFFSLFKPCPAFEVDENFLELFISKLRPSDQCESFLIVLFQLDFEVRFQILFFFDKNTFVAIVHQCFYQAVL